ncbi:glycosyltransferase [Sphingomonas sp. PP-CC-3A-396]|uniref:glycosyltransferase n=1 Tax=Sphingomonas sp. PP-CC-3A-396 TaxID=2135655 RepID=UPI001405227D|nr:glycosyltransferase [Sphingomonas sp. PP-CC-3A-396]
MVEGVKDVLAYGKAAYQGIVRRRRHPARTQKKHVLMIDDLVPDPLFGAGYPRAFAIVQSLVMAGHRVSFYPMRSSPADIERMTTTFAGAVLFHPGAGARGLRRLLWTHGANFDALFVSRPMPMAAFVQARWQPAADHPIQVVYDAEAVLAPREAYRRALFDTPWSDQDYKAAIADELEVARTADAVTAVGEGDATTIRSVLDMPVFVLPHPVAVRTDTASFGDRQDFLFVGRLTGSSSQSPNIDSVIWFVSAVMPILDRLIGTAYRLHVVGRIESAEIEALTSQRVVLHGVVEDLQPVYDRCRVFVAPTRYAAGIPLKVVEAMGEGIPCVVTPLLAEQLALGGRVSSKGTRPQDLQAEDTDARQFAQDCARLYTDHLAWQAARDHGTAHVTRCFSQKAFDTVLQDVLEQDDRPRGAHGVPFSRTIR